MHEWHQEQVLACLRTALISLSHQMALVQQVRWRMRSVLPGQYPGSYCIFLREGFKPPLDEVDL